MSRFRLATIVSVSIIGGCSSMKPEDFTGDEPSLVLEEYFDGKTRAWGMFEDRFGDLRAQFVVDIAGHWDGKQPVLDEDFTYADGRKDRRLWLITRIDKHRYEGTAADIIGVATGLTYGNALNWQYDMDLKVGDNSYRVHFDDWMFLQPDGVLLNRARVRKWGIEIGEVTLAFRRVPDGAVAPVDPAIPAADANP